MILIPQHLLYQPFMSQILSDGHAYILRKNSRNRLQIVKAILVTDPLQ